MLAACTKSTGFIQFNSRLDCFDDDQTRALVVQKRGRSVKNSWATLAF